MKELLILNGVPTYKQAPVPMNILLDNASEIFEKMLSENAERNIILIDKEELIFIEQIQKAACDYDKLNVEILKVEPEFRSFANNESAVMNLLKGVNPLPKSMEVTGALVNVENYMNIDKKQVYVLGKINDPGMRQVSKKMTPRGILDQYDVEKEFKGMYFGYPMGRFIGAPELDELMEITTDYIVIYNEENCMLHELLHLAEEFAQISCGRCVFGYEGITQINIILEEIVQKKGKPEDLKKLEKLSVQMQSQTVCDVGSVISTLVRDALNNFGEEIENHITQKVCQAMVCEKFMTYHILASKCIGCMDCIDACEDEAILGKSRFVHVINQNECTQCGACISKCFEEAIIKAGALKPKCPPKPIPCIKK